MILKKTFLTAVVSGFLCLSFALTSCKDGGSSIAAAENEETEPSIATNQSNEQESQDNLIQKEEAESMNPSAAQQLLITVNGHELHATLSDNPSTEALIELLQQGPLTIEMSDYASMEKVGPIGRSLPRTDESITTGPGDIILYQGDKLVIYYDTNSWNFTSIGKIQDVSAQELKSILGSGDVSVTFSL